MEKRETLTTQSTAPSFQRGTATGRNMGRNKEQPVPTPTVCPASPSRNGVPGGLICFRTASLFDAPTSTALPEVGSALEKHSHSQRKNRAAQINTRRGKKCLKSTEPAKPGNMKHVTPSRAVFNIRNKNNNRPPNGTCQAPMRRLVSCNWWATMYLGPSNTQTATMDRERESFNNRNQTMSTVAFGGKQNKSSKPRSEIASGSFRGPLEGEREPRDGRHRDKNASDYYRETGPRGGPPATAFVRVLLLGILRHG